MWQKLERLRTVLQITIASATICASVAIWWQKVVPAWMAIVLVVASAGIGFFLGRRSAPITPPMSGDGSSELIDTIAFKYSDLPTNHGWRITQDDINNPRQCQLMLQSDSEVGQYVRVEAENGARLEYPLQPSGFAADFIRVQYKPESGSAFYIRCHACGKGSDSQYWIQYQVGRDRPHPLPGSNGHEWIVQRQPSVLKDKWLTLDCDVLADFKTTFGRDGLEFEHLSLFRVRGNLSISAIRLYSAQLASRAAQG